MRLSTEDKMDFENIVIIIIMIMVYLIKGLSSREAARGHATSVDGTVLSATINRI